MNEPLDSPWMRRLSTFAVIPSAVGLILRGRDEIWSYVAALFGIVVCAYFVHLLLLRLQCSLFELLASSVLLASVVGLTISTHGVLQSPSLILLLLPMLVAWILYATIRAVVTAELLKVKRADIRTAWILVNAALLLSPALLLAGLLIFFGGYFKALSGSEFTPYGMPLAVLGVVGIALDCYVRSKVKRAARVAVAGAMYANAVAAAAIDRADNPL